MVRAPHVSFYSRAEKPGEFRFVLIVGATSKLEILNRARATGGKRHDVVEFEERGLTTTSSRTDERTAALIARSNGAADRVRNPP